MTDRSTTTITQTEMESRLWDAAEELRVAMPEAQYASVIFPLMFWKYLSDTWDHNHMLFLEENEGLAGLSEEEAHEIEYRDYQSFEIPFVNKGKVGEFRASWSSVLASVTQQGLGARVRASLQAIETANPDKFSRLFGSMTWTSSEVLDPSVLARVISAMNRVPAMHEGNMSHDVLGGAYEYLLKRFSDGSGTRAGQFFTPREVVELIVEILKPQNFESVYDPTCGSGGMLIASANLLKSHGGRGYTLHLYGQEAVPDTAGVARMNLFMHNLTQFQVEVGDTLRDPRFKQPDGSLAQFDVILANPPYNLKWTPWKNDPRALGGVAPRSTADWAFLQHMIASMKPRTGRAGVVLDHGVLSRAGQEAAIRQRVLEDDLLEAVIGLPAKMFYNTPIPTCILVFRASGSKATERKAGVVFVDASQRYTKLSQSSGMKSVTFTNDDVADILAAYGSAFDARGKPIDFAGGSGIRTRLVPLEEVELNGWDLNIGTYVGHTPSDQGDIDALLDAYNEARAQREQAESLSGELDEDYRWEASDSGEWTTTTLDSVLTRVKRKVPVEVGVAYPAVSVQMYGRGLGPKDPFVGGESKYDTLLEVHEGDVVLRTITAFEAPAAIARPEHHGMHVSGVFITYEVDDRALPEFLGLFFQTPAFWSEMNNRASGTVLRRKTISDAAFRGIPITLPPRSVQRRIVDLIDGLDDRIAVLLSESTRLRGLRAVEAERLREVRAAVLSALLTRKVDLAEAERMVA